MALRWLWVSYREENAFGLVEGAIAWAGIVGSLLGRYYFIIIARGIEIRCFYIVLVLVLVSSNHSCASCVSCNECAVADFWRALKLNWPGRPCLPWHWMPIAQEKKTSFHQFIAQLVWTDKQITPPESQSLAGSRDVVGPQTVVWVLLISIQPAKGHFWKWKSTFATKNGTIWPSSILASFHFPPNQK